MVGPAACRDGPMRRNAMPVPFDTFRMQPAEKAAHEILANIEATYQATHDYRTVNAKSFKHLDLGFYDRTARILENHGFRTLADVEDATITAAPGVLMPVLIRSLLSRDGTIMASLYHPRIKGLFIRFVMWILRQTPGKVVDMETEFTDGSFVLTSNAASAAAMELPSLISGEYHPFKTTAHEIHQRHLLRVAAHLESRPGVTARTITTHDELVASQNRQNAIKAAFRGEIGGITREELERLSTFGKGLARDVHAEIRAEQLRRAG